MTGKARILLVEDSPSNAMLYQNYLQDDYIVVTAHDGQQSNYYFQAQAFDLILLDVQLPDISGLDLLKSFREQQPALPIVIVTAHGSVDVALNAMRHGANDFLCKPFDKARLIVTVTNLLKGHQLSRLVENYEKSCKRAGFAKMVGSSLAMQSVYNIIESAANSKATVFITGESGTGKELCAEAIHSTSDRKNKPFIALNCAAIPHDLLESEIFGHVKGAFTGASTARHGAAEQAHQGTLFLDEIGEMPMSLQSKLLRFIQTGRFQPVGGSSEIERDIRFVCATNRDPLEEVRAGRFREDLYYRLFVIPIHMPALRERAQDVLVVAQSILEVTNREENKDFSGFSAPVRQLFMHYSWPGNVRELQNVVRQAVVLNEGKEITLDMLPQKIKLASSDVAEWEIPKTTSSSPSLFNNVETSHFDTELTKSTQQTTIEPLWLAEKRYIEQAIEQCQGNIPKAAAFLEVSPSTIYRKKQLWEEKFA